MQTKQIYFKSDFSITERSEAGYSVPFRFAYYTNAPSRAFVAEYDGTTYRNCHLDDAGNLVICFDDHRMGLGTLMVQRTYFLPVSDFGSGICDEEIAPEKVVALINGERCWLSLALQGDTAINAVSDVQPYWAKGDKGEKGDKGDKGEKGDKGDQGISGGLLFPDFHLNPETGILTVSGLEQDISRINFTPQTGEMVISIW